MALTANTLPANPPLPSLPLDASLQFSSAQVVTATGYLNNVNSQVDLANGGSGLGAGRAGFFAVVDITALSGTTPSFQFHVFGSNDVNFGNGNVEDIMEFDWAVTGTRLVATIIGASPAFPDPARGGTLIIKPFWNLGAGMIVYRYLRMYVVVAGTTPSITVTAWASPWEMKY